MAYHTRIIEKQIAKELEQKDSVYLEGSMLSGKSALLKKTCGHVYDVRKAMADIISFYALDIDKSIAFKGKGVHGIDSIDLCYEISSKQSGKAVYASSRSTGKEHLTLYPLSLYEQGLSNGAVSLSGLFSGAYEDDFSASSSLTLPLLRQAIRVGGYPSSLGKKTASAPNKIIDALLNGALAKESKTEQSGKRLEAILKAYASNVSTIGKNTDMLRALRALDPTLAESTLYDVINAMKRLLIIDEIEAWCPKIKAAATIRRLAKKEFVDPSLALSALKKSESDLEKDPLLLSRLFEGEVARDLRVYGQALGGKLSYYEDRFLLKADLRLALPNGKYALIQARLGEKDARDGEKDLLEIKRKILLHDARFPADMITLPSFMMVITCGEKAYRSKSGVYYCPLGCLGE